MTGEHSHGGVAGALSGGARYKSRLAISFGLAVRLRQGSSSCSALRTTVVATATCKHAEP